MIDRFSVLYNGMTFATFDLSGKIPVVRDWLIIIAIGATKAGAKNLSNTTDIPSGPAKGFERKLFNIFLIYLYQSIRI